MTESELKTSILRWITASIANYFDSNRGSLNMHFEGIERDRKGDTTHNTNTDEFFELRIDGPNIKEYSKKYFYCYVEVNCLIQSLIDEDDVFKLQTVLGKVTNLFGKSIQIYKYGAETGDDESLVGCLVQINDTRNHLQVNNFGQVHQDTRIQQGSVEAHYEMHLTINS